MDEDTNIITNDTPEEKSEGKKSNSLLIFGVVLALVVVGVVIFAKNARTNKMVAGDATESAPTADESTETYEEESYVEDASMEVQDETIEDDQPEEVEVADAVNGAITVEGGTFYFKPNTIRVKKGQPVTITLNNVEGIHDIVIDELNVQSKKINGGETDTVTFTPTQAGSYEFYCSIGNHRQMGMKGTLIVE